MSAELETTDGAGIPAAISALMTLTEETIHATRLGQVVETDLLTMRIGIIAEALRHSDRASATEWLPALNALSDRLSDLSAILHEQEAKLKKSMAERAQRALDAYR